MIFKIIKRNNAGVGSALAAVKYVESNKDSNGLKRELCEHLYGDGQHVIDMTESMMRKWRYLSSTLSFTKAESEKLNIEEITKISIEAAAHLTVGVGLENVPTTIQLHKKDGAYDVHIIQARFDMSRNKSFDPFVTKRGDLKRMKLFQDIYNLSNPKLDNPRDPVRTQIVHRNLSNMPKKSRQLALAVMDIIEEMAFQDLIQNRDDVIRELNAIGFIIVHKSKEYISVKSPDLKRAIRLKGAVFHDSFKGIREIQDRAEEYRTRSYTEVTGNLAEISAELASRDAKRVRSFSKQTIEEDHDISIGTHRHDDNNRNNFNIYEELAMERLPKSTPSTESSREITKEKSPDIDRHIHRAEGKHPNIQRKPLPGSHEIKTLTFDEVRQVWSWTDFNAMAVRQNKDGSLSVSGSYPYWCAAAMIAKEKGWDGADITACSIDSAKNAIRAFNQSELLVTSMIIAGRRYKPSEIKNLQEMIDEESQRTQKSGHADYDGKTNRNGRRHGFNPTTDDFIAGFIRGLSAAAKCLEQQLREIERLVTKVIQPSPKQEYEENSEFEDDDISPK